MRRRRSLGLVCLAVVLVVTVVLVVRGCRRPFDDPASAQCAAPPVTFGQPVDQGDHQEVAVGFTCEGARLAGTLYLPTPAHPTRPGHPSRHPAVVWIHGGQQTARLRYGDLVAAFVRGGVGFFSYDKRGGGQSQGECCPGDYGHFNLLTADAVGAVNALRARAGIDIDPQQLGLVGASQAGWIAPRAAVTSGQVAFIALASAGILPYGQVKAYAQLTGGNHGSKPFPSKDKIAKRVGARNSATSGRSSVFMDQPAEPISPHDPLGRHEDSRLA